MRLQDRYQAGFLSYVFVLLHLMSGYVYKADFSLAFDHKPADPISIYKYIFTYQFRHNVAFKI